MSELELSNAERLTIITDLERMLESGEKNNGEAMTDADWLAIMAIVNGDK